MKKFLIILPILLLCCNCKTSNNSSLQNISNDLKESVVLTTKNFSTYISTNSSVSWNNESNDYATYFTYFIGVDGCKYIDCTITYGYAYMNEEYKGEGNTVSLSLSGNGEAKPFHIRLGSTHSYYTFVLLNVSGIVEVYI